MFVLSWMNVLSWVMLIFSYLIAFMSDSFFFIWFSFELNLVSFIFLMWDMKTVSSINSMMKYFLIQSLISMIFLFMLLIFEIMNLTYIISNMMILILLLKMGVFPFMFWLLDVVEGMSMSILIFFFSLQKIIPLYVISMVSFYYLDYIIILTTLFSLFMMLNQFSIRKFLMFSSMVHSGWMMMSLMLGFKVWLLYLIIYLFILLGLLNLSKLDSFFQIKFTDLNEKLIIMMMFLNLSGLPPFLGFFSKVLILSYLMEYNLGMMIYLILLSIFSSYIYMMYLSFMFFYKNISFNLYFYNKINYYMLYVLVSVILMVVLVIYF
uniref:NADH-ubiquinone oxidoreductase chain 2 n=1 Tax=Laelaps sp. TaxID=3081785 RepID=A0AAU6QE85_9ACAR